MFKDLREADWFNFVCGFFLSFATKRRLEVGTNKKKALPNRTYDQTTYAFMSFYE